MGGLSTGLMFFRLQFWHGLVFWYDVLEVAAYTVFFLWLMAFTGFNRLWFERLKALAVQLSVYWFFNLA